MAWRSELRIKDGIYYFARVFISATGPVKRYLHIYKPLLKYPLEVKSFITCRWSYVNPVSIGTSKETAVAVVQPMEGRNPTFRSWWDEENKTFFEELIPPPPPEGRFSLLLTRTVEGDMLSCHYAGTRLSDNATCYMKSTWKRLPESEKI